VRTYLTIKNYRCFVRPVTVEISKGFSAFVGVNNAGKSAIMRFLLEFRPFLQAINVQQLAQLIPSGAGLGFQPNQVLDPQEIFSNRNNNPIEFTITFQYEPSDGTRSWNSSEEVLIFTVTRNMLASAALIVDATLVRRGGAQLSISNTMLHVNGQQVSNLQTIAGVLSSLASTLYVGPFRNAINAGTKADYLDIQVGQPFITQFRELKTGNSKKQNLDISNLTEEIRKVFRFDSLDISPTSNNTSLHLTVNGKAYKQHEVGSGLAQFVIVLANAAIQNRKWILIDEPELNLHPALQLEFLTTLGKYAEEGVWYSTHSIGLARSAASKVYSVVRLGDGDSDIRPLGGTPRLAEFLGEMSFSSHKELGFEKILLVEGPTEVPAIQQFLRMIGRDHLASDPWPHAQIG
jgi:predicted ATP-dependent endonuclease of OLD family